MSYSYNFDFGGGSSSRQPPPQFIQAGGIGPGIGGGGLFFGQQQQANPRQLPEVTKILRRPMPLNDWSHEISNGGQQQQHQQQIAPSSGQINHPTFGNSQFNQSQPPLGDFNTGSQDSGGTSQANPNLFGSSSTQQQSGSTNNAPTQTPQLNPQLPFPGGQFNGHLHQAQMGGQSGLSKSQQKKLKNQRGMDRSMLRNVQEPGQLQNKKFIPPFGVQAAGGGFQNYNYPLSVAPHFQGGQGPMFAGVWHDDGYQGYYGGGGYGSSDYSYGYMEGENFGADGGLFPRPHLNPKFIPPGKGGENFQNPYQSVESENPTENTDRYDPNYPTITPHFTSTATGSERSSGEQNQNKNEQTTQQQTPHHSDPLKTDNNSFWNPQRQSQSQPPLAVVHASRSDTNSWTESQTSSTNNTEMRQLGQTYNNISGNNGRNITSTTDSTANENEAITGQKKNRIMTGIVSQFQPGRFGMISGEIFFQESVVEGEKPGIGDKVVVEAEAVTGLPFKYHARKVTKLDEDLVSNSTRPPVPEPPVSSLEESKEPVRRDPQMHTLKWETREEATTHISTVPNQRKSNETAGHDFTQSSYGNQDQSHAFIRRNPSPQYTRREPSPQIIRRDRNVSPPSTRRQPQSPERHVPDTEFVRRAPPPPLLSRWNAPVPQFPENQREPSPIVSDEDKPPASANWHWSPPRNRVEVESPPPGHWDCPSAPGTTRRNNPRHHKSPPPKITRVLPKTPAEAPKVSRINSWNFEWKEGGEVIIHNQHRKRHRSRSQSPIEDSRSPVPRRQMYRSRSRSAERDRSSSMSSSRRNEQRNRARSRSGVNERSRRNNPDLPDSEENLVPNPSFELDVHSSRDFDMPPQEDEIFEAEVERWRMNEREESGNAPIDIEEAERLEEEIHQQQFLEEESRCKAQGNTEALNVLYHLEDKRRRRLEERQLYRIRQKEVELCKQKRYGELQRLRADWGPPQERFEQENLLREKRLEEERIESGLIEQGTGRGESWHDGLEEDVGARDDPRGHQGRVKRRRTPSPENSRGGRGGFGFNRGNGRNSFAPGPGLGNRGRGGWRGRGFKNFGPRR